MLTIQRIAKRIRHAPGLQGLDTVWNAVRRPYHWLIGLGGGAPVLLGGHVVVRMPAEFTNFDWVGYEPETVHAVASWVREHPRALVVDLGCAHGAFSLLALTVSAESRVIAFDSDLASLRAARRMCGSVGVGRFDLVHGFVSDASTTGGDLGAAIDATNRALAAGPPENLAATRYRNLHDGPDVTEGIPVRSLDQLRLAAAARGRPLLLKCDVEGAELQVLRGARGTLRALAPTLALSVHRAHLGPRTDDVRAILSEENYSVHTIAIDHEEHWWCEPPARG